MNKKIEYVPPVAEVILLAPCERLAAWDHEFGNVWRNPGKFTTDSGFTGIAFGDDKFDDYDTDSGFVIKTK